MSWKRNNESSLRRLNLQLISGETSNHTSDAVLELNVLGGVDERVDTAAGVHHLFLHFCWMQSENDTLLLADSLRLYQGNISNLMIYSNPTVCHNIKNTLTLSSVSGLFILKPFSFKLENKHSMEPWGRRQDKQELVSCHMSRGQCYIMVLAVVLMGWQVLGTKSPSALQSQVTPLPRVCWLIDPDITWPLSMPCGFPVRRAIIRLTPIWNSPYLAA